MRLTLSEACLMEASGELGEKARARLHEYIHKYPAALLEFEITRGNLELLRSAPKPEFSEEAKKRISGAIKVGIQQKLWRAKHEQQAARRWKLIYRALAGVAGVAACLVIAGGVLWVKKQGEAAQLARAEQVIDAYLAVDTPNSTDVAFSAVDGKIALLEQEMASGPTVGNPVSGPSAVLRFASEMDITPEDEMDFGPTIGL